jgi:hypothetical protein
MHVTELLVTGYDGDEANIVLTSTDNSGQTVVDSARRQTTDIFAEIQELLEQVVGAACVVQP